MVCFGFKSDEKSYFDFLWSNIDVWYIATYMIFNMEKY